MVALDLSPDSLYPSCALSDRSDAPAVNAPVLFTETEPGVIAPPDRLLVGVLLTLLSIPMTLAATVLSMVSWVLITVHYFKPEYISRWICQLYVALVAVVSVITFMYATIGATASVLVNPDKWNQFYYITEGWSCADLGEDPYIGVGFTAVALSMHVIVYFVVAFPTCLGRCYYCVGDGPSDFEVTKGIVEDNRRGAGASDYVPPHV